jgi:hypothetical protein
MPVAYQRYGETHRQQGVLISLLTKIGAGTQTDVQIQTDTRSRKQQHDLTNFLLLAYFTYFEKIKVGL